MREIEIVLPRRGVVARARLLEEEAPLTCDFVWRALERPVEAKTLHAMWSGREVFWYIPEAPDPPPVENHTIYPEPGELMFFYMPRNRLKGVRDFAHLPTHDVYELAVFYGESSLRHYMELGWRGNVFAVLTEGRESFIEACNDIYLSGTEPLLVRRAEP